MKRLKTTLSVLALAGTLSLFAGQKKEQILMEINGKPITLSEFEYMYHKNNQQQAVNQPLDKYIDMFTIYKLKVADAEAAGIDTTKAFQNEFYGYKEELLKPYLLDTMALEVKAKEMYERMKTNVLASHIMLQLGRDANDNKKIIAKLDSIRNCALNGESFEDLALKYSIDQSVKYNKGSMGYVQVGRFPSEFEDACFTTPVGEISPVFATDFGFHIVKTYEIRPDAGKVQVQHILKLFPQNATAEQKQEVKETVDSLYLVLKAGADFSEMAKKESEDPGSARQGGMLPLFGRGQMVPEFEQVSYELDNGMISQPFATRYGYHIVKKISSQAIGSYAEMREQALAKVSNDTHGNVALQAKMEQLKKQYRLMRNTDLERRMIAEVFAPNKFDSAFIAKYSNSNETLFTLDGIDYPVSALISQYKNFGVMRDEVAKEFLNSKFEENINKTVTDYEKSMVEKNNVDFRNLINEYRDGMLLFEISNKNVWEKASVDTEGLEKFFAENKNKYKWESPKYKGFLVQVTNDSVAKVVKERIKTIGQDSLVKVLRRDFGKVLKVDRVLVAKGENAMVDSEMFGGVKAKTSSNKYSLYFTVGGKILPQPEEVADVRGLVIADYQNYLEKKWIEELKAKYPVKINRKVYKKIK